MRVTGKRALCSVVAFLSHGHLHIDRERENHLVHRFTRRLESRRLAPDDVAASGTGEDRGDTFRDRVTKGASMGSPPLGMNGIDDLELRCGGLAHLVVFVHTAAGPRPR
jgi:hypothetical protein